MSGSVRLEVIQVRCVPASFSHSVQIGVEYCGAVGMVLTRLCVARRSWPRGKPGSDSAAAPQRGDDSSCRTFFQQSQALLNQNGAETNKRGGRHGHVRVCFLEHLASVPNDSGIPHGPGSFWKRCHFRCTRGNLPAIPALGQSRGAQNLCDDKLDLAAVRACSWPVSKCTFPKQRLARRLGFRVLQYPPDAGVTDVTAGRRTFTAALQGPSPSR
jgi:hypothetical protein